MIKSKSTVFLACATLIGVSLGFLLFVFHSKDQHDAIIASNTLAEPAQVNRIQRDNAMSNSNKIATLEAELVSLKHQLRELTSLIKENLDDNSNANKQQSAGSEAPEISPELVQTLTQDTYHMHWESEPVDYDWSLSRENEISDFFEYSQAHDNIKIKSLECRQSICKLVANETFDPEKESLGGLLAFKPFGTGAYFYTDADGQTVAFVARAGHELPMVDMEAIAKNMQ